MPPYAKYMKDIITNKRKIPEAEISTMLANYTFKDGVPKKLGDLRIPTIPWSIKKNYVKTALCDLGAGVSVMPFSLYKRLDLGKLTHTEISLQMADKLITHKYRGSQQFSRVEYSTQIYWFDTMGSKEYSQVLAAKLSIQPHLET